jgi:hypothetical protein
LAVSLHEEPKNTTKTFFKIRPVEISKIPHTNEKGYKITNAPGPFLASAPTHPPRASPVIICFRRLSSFSAAPRWWVWGVGRGFGGVKIKIHPRSPSLLVSPAHRRYHNTQHAAETQAVALDQVLELRTGCGWGLGLELEACFPGPGCQFGMLAKLSSSGGKGHLSVRNSPLSPPTRDGAAPCGWPRLDPFGI